MLLGGRALQGNFISTPERLANRFSKGPKATDGAFSPLLCAWLRRGRYGRGVPPGLWQHPEAGERHRLSLAGGGMFLCLCYW